LIPEDRSIYRDIMTLLVSIYRDWISPSTTLT